MKKLFSLLLLPVFLMAQPKEQYYNAPFLSESVSDFIVQDIESDIVMLHGLADEIIKPSLSADTRIENYKSARNLQKFSDFKTSTNELPRHLITFSFFDTPRVEGLRPQNQSNNLFIVNNIDFPREDTLFPWLKSINSGQLNTSGAMNNFQGFGPRILL